VLEDQRGPTAGTLHAAIRDLGHFQPSAHRVRDADQLAGRVDGAKKVSEIREGHNLDRAKGEQ
jgi:hypothetical protein